VKCRGSDRDGESKGGDCDEEDSEQNEVDGTRKGEQLNACSGLADKHTHL